MSRCYSELPQEISFFTKSDTFYLCDNDKNSVLFQSGKKPAFFGWRLVTADE